MTRIIGLVGHCGPDSYMLRSAVKYAVKDADVRMLNSDGDLQKAVADGCRLLLVNRMLDGGFEQGAGIDLIKTLAGYRPEVRCMLISNYADAQAGAEAAGALRGFGKSHVGSPTMRQALADAVEASDAEAAK